MLAKEIFKSDTSKILYTPMNKLSGRPSIQNPALAFVYVCITMQNISNIISQLRIFNLRPEHHDCKKMLVWLEIKHEWIIPHNDKLQTIFIYLSIGNHFRIMNKCFTEMLYILKQLGHTLAINLNATAILMMFISRMWNNFMLGIT